MNRIPGDFRDWMTMMHVTLPDSTVCDPHPPDAGRKTAILIVAGQETPAEQAFRAIRSLYGDFYSQIIFLSMGLLDYAVVDAQDFKGSEVPGQLKQAALGAIERSRTLAKQAGVETLTCLAIGTNPVDAVEKQAVELARACPGAMFFMAKLVSREERWWHALLHPDTAQAIQKRLEKRGLPLAVLPVILPEEA